MGWTAGSIPLDGTTGFTLATVDLGVGMVDTAVITSVHDWDSDDLSVGTWLAVKQNGTTVLWGSVTSVKPYAQGGGAQGRKYTISNPWWQIEMVTYKQEFLYRSGSGYVEHWRSKVWLGSGRDGARLNTLQVIEDILGYAASQGGVPFGYAVSGFGLLAPVTEAVDQTCAALVMQLLRWHPNVQVYWRYTGTSATLHIKPLSALTDRTIDVSDASLDGPQPITAEVHAREDMVPPCVVVKYERVNKVIDPDEGEIVVMEYNDDSAGSGSEHAPGALVFTIELKGINATSLVQPVRVRRVPDEFADGAYTDDEEEEEEGEGGGGGGGGEAVSAADMKKAVKWYQCHVAVFRTLDPEAIEIMSHLKILDTDISEPEEDEEGEPIPDPEDAPPPLDEEELDPSEFPRELIEGTVQEWMVGVKAAPMIARGKFRWQGSETAEADEDMMAWARKVFGEGLDKELEYDVRYMATDATNRRYRTVAGWEAAEAWPTGLADAIYADLGTVRHEGSVTVRGDDCHLAVQAGDMLALVGQTGSGPVQRVTLEPQTGRTTLQFGWPGHLSAQDIYELQRASRANVSTATYDPKRRDEGKGTNENAAVAGALRSPRADVQPRGGGSGDVSHAWKPRAGSEPGKVIITPGTIDGVMAMINGYDGGADDGEEPGEGDPGTPLDATEPPELTFDAESGEVHRIFARIKMRPLVENKGTTENPYWAIVAGEVLRVTMEIHPADEPPVAIPATVVRTASAATTTTGIYYRHFSSWQGTSMHADLVKSALDAIFCDNGGDPGNGLLSFRLSGEVSS